MLMPIVSQPGGVAAGPAPGTINLTGTAGSPNVASRTATGTAVAGWDFRNDKDIFRRQGSWADWGSNWLGATGSVGDWEIRATKDSGNQSSLSTGNLNTWESLSTSRIYELSNNVNGTTKDIVLKIEIRVAIGSGYSDAGTIKDTGYYKIEAIDSGGGTTTTTTATATTETTTTA